MEDLINAFTSMSGSFLQVEECCLAEEEGTCKLTIF